MDRLFSRPVSHFGASSSHFGFCRWCGIAGSVALQAVSECPWHRYAGICKHPHFYCTKVGVIGGNGLVIVPG